MLRVAQEEATGAGITASFRRLCLATATRPREGPKHRVARSACCSCAPSPAEWFD